MNVHPEPAAVAQPPRSGSRLRAVLVGLAALALLATFRLLPVNEWLLTFVSWIRGAGATGMVLFALAYVVACVVLLPGLILTLGAGFAYGVAVGIPLVWVSANLGAAVAFLLGRTLARERIAARVAGNPKFAAIDRAVGTRGPQDRPPHALVARLPVQPPQLRLRPHAGDVPRLRRRLAGRHDSRHGDVRVPGLPHHQRLRARRGRAVGRHGEAAPHLARLRGDGGCHGGHHAGRAPRARRSDRGADRRGTRARAISGARRRRAATRAPRRRPQPAPPRERAPDRVGQPPAGRALQPGRGRRRHRRAGVGGRRRRPRRAGWPWSSGT